MRISGQFLPDDGEDMPAAQVAVIAFFLPRNSFSYKAFELCPALETADSRTLIAIGFARPEGGAGGYARYIAII